MSVGAAQDRHVQHAGQGVVVEVVALPGDEAVVLEPLDRMADAADLGRGRGLRLGGGHDATPAVSGSRLTAAAARIAFTMFM